jgi:hypothetical protein
MTLPDSPAGEPSSDLDNCDDDSNAEQQNRPTNYVRVHQRAFLRGLRLLKLCPAYNPKGTQIRHPVSQRTRKNTIERTARAKRALRSNSPSAFMGCSALAISGFSSPGVRSVNRPHMQAIITPERSNSNA